MKSRVVNSFTHHQDLAPDHKNDIAAVSIGVPIVIVGLVPPAVSRRKRGPKALVVWVVDGIGPAREVYFQAGVRRAPRLLVALKLMPPHKLDGRAWVSHAFCSAGCCACPGR